MRTSSWRGALHTRSSEIGLLIVVALAIFLVEQVKWDAGLQSQVSWLVNPISKQTTAGISVISQPLRFSGNIFTATSRLQQLERQQAALLAEIAQLEKIEQENQQLRAMIEQENITAADLTVAAPIASYAYPAVAAGRDQDIIEGQLVMIDQNLVGIVTQVEDHQARISLLSDIQSRPILVSTDAGAKGLLKGTGKQLLITQVMPDAQLLAGEKVVTVGQPGIDAGLFIGLVGEKENSLTGPTQQAVVDQLVSFYASPLVTIN